METYEKLEFNTIKQKVTNYCVSAMAKEKVMNLLPLLDLEELHLVQEYLKDTIKLNYAYSYISLAPYSDVKLLLEKASKGGTLFPVELNDIVNQLKNIQAVENYLSINEIEEGQILEITNQFYLPKDLLNDIVRCIDASGNVLDSASDSLRRIRRNIISIQASIRTTIESLKNKNKDYLLNDNISSRDDHLVLPVKATHKNKVNGVVRSVSATGQTLFIEPIQVVEKNSQLLQAIQEEEEEVQRILFDLSSKVSNYHDVLNSNQDTMIYLEYLFAIARYAKEIDGIIPSINEKNNEVKILKARHPLINKDEVVSNDIIIDNQHNIMLISGSNTGGKTVVLKTIGLLSLMALSGLPVSASEASIPFFDKILVDLGDDQSIEESLSTFSSHMKKVVSVTNEATNKSLVLLDEIGSGTDPQEGQSIGEAVLQYLHDVGCLTIASTHYSGLKQFAKREDYVLVAAVEFDYEAMRPTYRLIEGSVGNSNAIEISSRLGLNETIVRNAHIIKENNQTDSDKLLEKLQDELLQVQQKEEQLVKQINDSKNIEKRYQDKLAKINANHEKMMEEAKEAANKFLEEAKQQVDLVMEDLNKQNSVKPHVGISAKKYLDDAKYASDKKVNNEKREYKVGDIVKIISANRNGEIIDINKKGILTISMGALKLTAKPEEVEYMHKKVIQKVQTSNIKSLKKTTNQSYELNIIGKRYEEAMIEVDKFLDDAIVNNYTMVRIIHGMGSGVLRNGVRKMLDKNKLVTSYRDGGPNEGGLGATLVYFN